MEKCKLIIFDKYKQGLMVRALYEMRKQLLAFDLQLEYL